MTTASVTPLGTIPLTIGPHRFDLLSGMGAVKIAEVLSPPADETNAQAINRIIDAIAGQITDQEQRERFRELWVQPEYGQGLLLDLWEQIVNHYARRPTDGPSPSSSGFGIRPVGSTSTPGSSSPVALASPPSPTTSDAS